MDPSIHPAPPADSSVSRVKRSGVDMNNPARIAEEALLTPDLVEGLGATMLGGAGVEAGFVSRMETRAKGSGSSGANTAPTPVPAEKEEPKYEFKPGEGLSLDKFPDGSDLTSKNRLYAKAFVLALVTGQATTYTKGTEGKRAVEGTIKDDDGNVTGLIVSWNAGTKRIGDKQQTVTIPVVELEERIVRASNEQGYVIEPLPIEVTAPDLPFMRYPRSRVKSPEGKQKTEEAINANIAYLNELKKLYGADFSMKLSGDFEGAPKDFGHAPIDAAKIELIRMGVIAVGIYGVSSKNKTPWPANVSWGSGSERSFTRPGGDPVERTDEDMLDRSKFYLSLGSADLDPDVLRSQTTFLVDLVKGAMDRDIDISWKTMDHRYDQPCIYTAKPGELALLLAEMYNSEKYPKSMWNDVYRYFQSPLKGVSNKHIAVVQEPVDGFRGQSHSNRMQSLAKILSGPSGITKEDYCEAVRKCGLRPDEPGFLNEEAKIEYLKNGRSKMP